MKMKAIRPIYKDGTVILEGEAFTTSEQHGRELMTLAYAEVFEAEERPEPKRRAKKEQ